MAVDGPSGVVYDEHRSVLAEHPDQTVISKAWRCQHCHAGLAEADQTLDARYDKIDLPKVKPVVTRVERYAGRCRCCGGTTLAAVPGGLESGTPFSGLARLIQPGEAATAF